jgi:16S rRNA (cytidine1402-2'-O)-methyltransferase
VPADQFTFLGFPPSGGLARDRWFERLATEASTVVFYESPHRIERTMADASEVLVNRHTVVCRELTKVNEKLVIWDNNTTVRPQGEFVVVAGPATQAVSREPEADSVARFVGQIIEKLSLGEDAAMSLAAAHFAIPAGKVRKLLKKGRILLKRSSDNHLP